MKTAPWEPESDLDKALVDALREHFAWLAAQENFRAQMAGTLNWSITTHCHDRWAERFGRGLPLQGIHHPIHDLRSARLRRASAKEVDRILALCAGHAGEASRGTDYFILPDPEGGCRDRVFVAVPMEPGHRRYNPQASGNYVVTTCFPYLRNHGAALARSPGRQKAIRLRKGG